MTQLGKIVFESGNEHYQSPDTTNSEMIRLSDVVLQQSKEIYRLRANEKVLVEALTQCNEFAECANRSSHTQMKDALESVILTTRQALAQVKK